MSLCNTFKRLAFDTWDKIKESRDVGFQLKEETFTDINMLSIKKKHQSEVITKVFTKHEEGLNGADWEWWFRYANQWIGFRVQAKILNIHTDEFEHLHYQSPPNNFQCDKLIKTALTNTPRIPLYCLYLQTNDQNRLCHWPYYPFQDICEMWGCSLISAFDVRKLRSNQQKSLHDIEKFLIPWHCLVCCCGYKGDNIIERMHNYIRANFQINIESAQDLQVTIPKSFITERPPQYVLNLIDNLNNIENIDEDLRGIFIYTFKG